MKKLLFAILVIALFYAKSQAGGAGRTFGYQTITSTGVTGINFNKISTEIYVITFETSTAYVSWISSTALTSYPTNYFQLGESSNSDVIEHTEEVQSSRMSVYQANNPVNIRVQWKMW